MSPTAVCYKKGEDNTNAMWAFPWSIGDSRQLQAPEMKDASAKLATKKVTALHEYALNTKSTIFTNKAVRRRCR